MLHSPALAGVVLALHLAVIAFNVVGLLVIPLGGWLRWGFVRIRWWRALHLAALALVAVQAVAGRACFLTLWQEQLQGGPTGAPLIMGWVNAMIYWPLPMWVFTALYLAVLAYALALWWWVPPARPSVAAPA